MIVFRGSMGCRDQLDGTEFLETFMIKFTIFPLRIVSGFSRPQASPIETTRRTGPHRRLERKINRHLCRSTAEGGRFYKTTTCSAFEFNVALRHIGLSLSEGVCLHVQAALRADQLRSITASPKPTTTSAATWWLALEPRTRFAPARLLSLRLNCEALARMQRWRQWPACDCPNEGWQSLSNHDEHATRLSIALTVFR